METITHFNDKCIIVRIPIGINQRKGLYEATRRCWRASLQRSRKAGYVLGTVDGEILCVIKPDKCDYVPAKICNAEKETYKNVFGVNTALCKNKRVAFEGKELKEDTNYLHKIIPGEYMPGRNPVRYTYE
jgi:hypothetical protein